MARPQQSDKGNWPTEHSARCERDAPSWPHARACVWTLLCARLDDLADSKCCAHPVAGASWSDASSSEAACRLTAGASRLRDDSSCCARAKCTAWKELVAVEAETCASGERTALVEDVVSEHVEGGTFERLCEDVGDHLARGNEEWFDDVPRVQVLDEHDGPFEVTRARGAAWLDHCVPGSLVVS
eukprot:scaffold7529_cov143-Isochrysis_galbana.AAC.4